MPSDLSSAVLTTIFGIAYYCSIHPEGETFWNLFFSCKNTNGSIVAAACFLDILEDQFHSKEFFRSARVFIQKKLLDGLTQILRDRVTVFDVSLFHNVIPRSISLFHSPFLLDSVCTLLECMTASLQQEKLLLCMISNKSSLQHFLRLLCFNLDGIESTKLLKVRQLFSRMAGTLTHQNLLIPKINEFQLRKEAILSFSEATVLMETYKQQYSNTSDIIF